MKANVKSLFKNFSFSLLANLISMIISSLIVIIIPKFIGIDGYGLYQVYVLYIGYVGLLQFGLMDGIYLRYGGSDYAKLDRQKFYSQWVIMCISQVVMFFLIVIFSFLNKNPDKQIIVIATGICMILTNLRGLLTYVFQTTNRIREYSIASVIGRIIFLVGVLIGMLLGYQSYLMVVILDLVGRVVSLTYSIIQAKEIVFYNKGFKFDWNETISNYSVGLKLMLSNIASTLVLGIVKMCIEANWSISTFGKCSLTISISSLLVQFINAIALVLFPMLKRNNEKNQISVYIVLKRLVIPFMYIALLFYYPFKQLLLMWLPNYSDGLIYMSLLFPVCIYEGRQALINNTYLKAYGMEKKILKINIFTLLISAGLSILFSFYLKNLNGSMLTILIVLAFRCIYSDMLLAKIQHMNLYRETIYEGILMLSFVISSWFIGGYISTFIYFIFMICYFILERKKIMSALKKLCKLTMLTV